MLLGIEKTLPSTRISGAFAAALRDKLPIGSLFAGRYEIHSVLGVGGTGIVYEAYDRELDDLVAIKTLRWDLMSENSQLLGRFKQEVRLARRITHPNVLRTYDFGESNGLRFISMELVKGPTLKRLLETDIVPTAVGLRIAKQICAGLAAAHEVGVIHRDVKSQNILIEPTGVLKIMDFGTARVIEDRAPTGTVIGTPDYMSPEQARGCFLDHRSDVYSTGVVLYELFTGSLPFEGDSPIDVMLKHVNDAAPLPQSRNPWIEPEIAAILMKCLKKDPGARFQNMGALSNALTRVTPRPTTWAANRETEDENRNRFNRAVFAH
jgi:eukaryotic-like serine/threonine-protein kinase